MWKKVILRLCDGNFFRVSCQLSTSHEDPHAFLTNLIVHSPLDRGHGWGKRLLYAVRGWLSVNGCTHLHIDDCSDAYRRPQENVYLQVGATYDDPVEGPEMTWQLRQEGQEGQEGQDMPDDMLIVTELD